jgi:hypothetical protein
MVTQYYKDALASLPADDLSPTTEFTAGEYTNVLTVNGQYASQFATGLNYAVFLFKQDNGTQQQIAVNWTGQTTIATSSYAVYLEIYNRVSTTWEQLDSDTNTAANTDFNLSGNVINNLSNYYDGSNIVSFRVYQSGVTYLQEQLQAVSGLTFFKDYRPNVATLNADYASGSATATYTAARSAAAPSTYVDDSGVIQLLTTADVRRRQGGYYDATGFHAQSGEMIEAAGTNLFKDSYMSETIATYWTANGPGGHTREYSTERTPPYGTNCLKVVATSTDQRITYEPGIALTSGVTYTISILVRGSGSIAIGSGTFFSSAFTLQDNYWAKLSYSFTSDETATKWPQILYLLSNNNVTAYIADVQFEASPYATSFIPTTTAELTRAGEATGMRYAVSGNRTLATETIYIKMAVESDFANDGVERMLMDTETSRRQFGKFTNGTILRWSENGDRSAASWEVDPIVKNKSYVIVGVVQQSGNPNKLMYVDGVAQSSPDNTDMTDTFGTNFFLGTSTAPNRWINGIIQSVAIYSRVLSAEEVLVCTNILNSGAL